MSEVVPVDDAAEAVDDAVDEVADGASGDEVASLVEVASRLDGLGESVVEVGEQVDEVSQQVKALDASGGDAITGTVEIDGSQWQEFVSLKSYVEGSGAFMLFLVLLDVCIAAVVLGNLLWGNFSEGWRHG